MITLIMNLGIGILISVLGIVNMTGNISTIHSYHRERVTEENRKPFGRLVGLGTLIIGISVMIFGGLLFATEKTGNVIYAVIGTVELIIFIAVGMALSFYAMIKYNKGIF